MPKTAAIAGASRIGLSTHDPGDSEMGRRLVDTLQARFATLVGVAIIWPAIGAIGDGLREQRELGMAVKRAERERLEAGNSGASAQVATEEGGS